MIFKTNFPKIENDLSEIVRSYFSIPENIDIIHTFNESDSDYINIFTINNIEYIEKVAKPLTKTELERIRYIKRSAKIFLYKLLSSIYNEYHPWGSLTGIRPVKLYRQLIEKESIDAFNYFINNYLVSSEKTHLTKQIYDIQKSLYSTNKNDIDLYIGIPFCVSRCYYCSFISTDLRTCNNDLVDTYLDSLIVDINKAKELLQDYNLRSVYIGGGTPTSLNEKQLEKLLYHCNFKTNEFTIEAGRPDTITEEKLRLISNVANRISVNPQTSKDITLTKIGRSHTFTDFVKAYEMAKKYDFQINCDLIAGLIDENVEDFTKSVNDVVNLFPENITLHTLSLKAGSKLKESTNTNINNQVYSMINNGYEILKNNGYKPYYLYRQKYMAGNLENTGFYKNSPCIYNIDIMEENTSIIACGANSISKRVYLNDNRIERFAYPKDVKTYIEKIEINTQKREELFKND